MKGSEPTVVFHASERRVCMEARLVLAAVGIASEPIRGPSDWELVVRADDFEAATAELDSYRLENAEAEVVAPPTAIHGGAAAAVLAYAVILVSLFAMERREAFDFDWRSAGQMRAGDVLAGEWWRTVTALTLHADAVHLTANLGYGAVFGFLAGRILGGGVAWLAILVAGAIGNGLNAAVQPADHTSIGASTAVFAALGLIVAHALRGKWSEPETMMKRWSPVIGGAVLLALTGVGGERTDVMAHFTGFLAGVAVGSIGCRLPDRWLAHDNLQFACGLLAIGIVATAWVIALLT
jgi:membrane associated rhomboid family serine protease